MTTTRRHFLATAAGAGVLAAQNVSPNDRVRIALIGAGGQGSADTRNALSVGGVELAAVADIYDGRLKRAREVWGEQVFTTRDYREVLARKDVDAVFVATPDHWHSAIAIDAMNAGKDVYCEKPMVQQLSQGAQMIEAQKRTGRIVQVGSQRVSSIVYAKAKEMLSSGALSALNRHSGAKVLGTFQDAIENDPDLQVKRRAVGALQSMPDGEGIPLLIQLAKATRDNEVRKQAMTSLGQSRDGRAISFFEEVLKK